MNIAISALMINCKSNNKKNCHAYHNPVLRVHDMHWSLGFSLYSLMDDATSHTINQQHPNKAALLMHVCTLSHHSQ